MFGKDYVWIWPGTFNREGWLSGNIVTDCEPEHVIEAASGHFSIHTLLISFSEQPTITGKVFRFKSSIWFQVRSIKGKYRYIYVILNPSHINCPTIKAVFTKMDTDS